MIQAGLEDDPEPSRLHRLDAAAFREVNQVALERLSPLGKCCSGDDAGAELTPAATLEGWFRDAAVDAFASSHTCPAQARDLRVDGRDRAIFNNGAAGLPNFAGEGFGIVTRVSVDPTVPADSLYGLMLEGVRFDALPVHYDTAAWIARFLANWPPGSPAHEAYFGRIVSGRTSSAATRSADASRRPCDDAPGRIEYSA